MSKHRPENPEGVPKDAEVVQDTEEGDTEEGDTEEGDTEEGVEEIDEAEILDSGLEPEAGPFFEDSEEGDEQAPAADIIPVSAEHTASSKALVRYDPLQSYLAEIRHIPTLSREEEQELALRYRQGDRKAGMKLVLANLRLVVMVAREYQRSARNILDLVQEGNIGLLEALDRFDPFRGIRFPSYAVYWVRAYMLRYLIQNVRLVKIGTTQAQRKLFFNLVKEKEKLEQEGFVPEAKLLAKRLNVKESEVLEMEQRLALPDLSVDAPMTVGDDTVDLHGVLPDSSASVEDVVVEGDFAGVLRENVLEFSEQADEKERAIIDQRLLNDEPATLQVIADQFGVSRERIRQIEARLKERLGRFLRERMNLSSEGEVVIDEE